MKLDEIFPPNSFSDNEIDLLVYSRDASGFEGKCVGVVWPTKLEQIHQLVHYAKRTGQNLTIRGAATSTAGGTIPKDSIVVDMSKMNNILEIGSDYVIVEAGVVLDDLQKELAKKKKYFPVVPLEHAVCTVGGMVATNCLGMNTYYGKMQDWITELQIIDGTGMNMKITGIASKPFIGSEGCLGIICKIKLKVLQKPMMKSVSLFKFNTITTLMEKVTELNKNPNVLEIIYLDDLCSKNVELGETLHLIVEYKDEFGSITNKEEIDKIDDIKENLPHLLIKKRYGQIEDPIIPMQQMAKFLHWIRKKDVPVYAYMKMGLVHANFRDYSKFPEEMYEIVNRIEGKLIGDFPVGIKRKKFLTKFQEEQMIIFKNQYDNHKIMNRGVLVD
ncbi:MAG: FAD-binding oxidoreductase [Nanoarchaeota archaeon]|nr:FAD-binding oxidoreductase [Nanoarchaeota archaeon]